MLRHLAGFPEAYYLDSKDLLSSHIPQSSPTKASPENEMEKRKVLNLSNKKQHRPKTYVMASVSRFNILFRSNKSVGASLLLTNVF